MWLNWVRNTRRRRKARARNITLRTSPSMAVAGPGNRDAVNEVYMFPGEGKESHTCPFCGLRGMGLCTCDLEKVSASKSQKDAESENRIWIEQRRADLLRSGKQERTAEAQNKSA
jgi:hypothetical protein